MIRQSILTGLNLENMKILMTGGSGLLGQAIQKLDKAIISPTHKELNITKPRSIKEAIKKYKPDVILHLAAANKPQMHETNPEQGLSVNIIGTANLCLACNKYNIKLIYTSTDYVYTGAGPHKEEEALYPPSKFVWSKLGGECAMRMLKKFLILRLDFGPIPFPWEKVYKDQFVSKLYISDMAPLVLKVVKSNVSGVMNLGGPKISLEEYAKKTRPKIKPVSKPDWVPMDTSMDITKLNTFLSNRK